MYELKALNIFKRYVAYIHNQIFYKVIFFSITKSSSFFYQNIMPMNLHV